jgi:hypothetical protein
MREWISHIQGWADREVCTPAIVYRDAAWLIDTHTND